MASPLQGRLIRCRVPLLNRALSLASCMCVLSRIILARHIELPIAQEILHRPHPDPSKKLTFNVSYFEIYKDEVYDLLGDRETVGCRSDSGG